MSTPCNSLDISQAGLVRFDGIATFTGVATTNHDVLVGAASNGITSVSPSTANKFLMSNGVAADPSFETISNSVLPGSGAITLSDGTNVTITGSPVSLGGSATVNVSGPPSATTLTNHGVVIGQATSAVTATATGSSGQVLQSRGASADPSYSTATYPTTAGANGTLLQSDGTNIVNTTATYPSVAGTSGNVLTSDGTNWNSSASTGVGLLKLATITLTNAQIKALHGTPVEVIAAPGSGKGIVVVGATAKFIYGGTNAFTAGASQTINLYYNNTGAQITSPSAFISNTMIVGTFNRFSVDVGLNINSLLALSPGLLDNVNVAAYNPVATEISGNAANDNTISLTIAYYIVTF